MQSSNKSSNASTDRLPSVKILFGSETGTAEDVAERIGRALQRHHVPVCVMPMDDYPRVRLRESLLINPTYYNASS